MSTLLTDLPKKDKFVFFHSPLSARGSCHWFDALSDSPFFPFFFPFEISTQSYQDICYYFRLNLKKILSLDRNPVYSGDSEDRTAQGSDCFDSRPISNLLFLFLIFCMHARTHTHTHTHTCMHTTRTIIICMGEAPAGAQLASVNLKEELACGEDVKIQTKVQLQKEPGAGEKKNGNSGNFVPESVSSSPIVRIFGKGKCKFIANFSATMVTSLPSISLSLSLSLSLYLSLSLSPKVPHVQYRKRFRASYNIFTRRPKCKFHEQVRQSVQTLQFILPFTPASRNYSEANQSN